MVSLPDSEVSGPGASPGRGHCIVFLGKTLCSPGGVLPYMGYIGMCRGIGYGFWRFSILK